MIADLTAQLLDNLIIQVNKPENRSKLNTYVVDPVIRHILSRVFPYLVGCGAVLVLIILLTLVTIGLMLYDIKARKLGA